MDEEGRNEMTFLEWIHGCFVQEAWLFCAGGRPIVQSQQYITVMFTEDSRKQPRPSYNKEKHQDQRRKVCRGIEPLGLRVMGL